MEPLRETFPFLSRFDAETGRVDGVEPIVRRLSDLAGCFSDEAAYQEALKEDPVVYTLSAVTPAEGDGQLHFGIGRINPGRVGAEYFLTKGHLHVRRETAEVYIGLSGEGLMLLEDEWTGESIAVALTAGSVVYVPGHTAHRTINTGDRPLVYIGVFPSDAGHDYARIAERNFRKVVVESGGRPEVVDRDSLRP